MQNNSKDLFDDSTMSFGEHLEVLRVHLVKALIGLFICVIGALFFGSSIVGVVRSPIDSALIKYGVTPDQQVDVPDDFSYMDSLKKMFGAGEDKPVENENQEPEPETVQSAVPISSEGTIVVKIDAIALAKSLQEALPDIKFETADGAEQKIIELAITAPEFANLQNELATLNKTLELVQERQAKPVTLTVQEAFITYLKVSFIAGLVIASPWVLYQMWLFVATGLYPHEQKYVYIYLPMSIFLFLGGSMFCFFLVFPFVLEFMLSFNAMLDVHPQIRLSEWISFAVTLPLMFGISFQLPLVMLFMERISIFEVADYREKRRMSILVIAIVSMLMTPADPTSMLLMMLPLLLLYELGILLCGFSPKVKSPFDEDGS